MKEIYKELKRSIWKAYKYIQDFSMQWCMLTAAVISGQAVNRLVAAADKSLDFADRDKDFSPAEEL